MASPLDREPAPTTAAPGPPPGGPAATQPAPSPAGPAGTAGGILPPDWTTQVADRIVSTVDAVRDRTTAPAQKVARAIVWAVPLLTVGLGALVATVLLTLRLLHELADLVPFIEDRPGRNVYVVDLLLGILLVAAGARIARKGRAPSAVD